MNTIGHAFLLVIVLTVAALAGLHFVRRLMKQENLTTNESAAEAMLGVVGTMFSVLLGFLIAGSMERYLTAQMHAEQEANGVASIFRLSRGLSDLDRPLIRTKCRNYVNQVVEVEWKMMERQELINHGWEQYQQLWESVVAINPENDRQSNLQQGINEAMMSVGEHRRARIVISQMSMSNALWAVVWLGAVITVCFTYVFASRFAGIQDYMTGLVAGALALNIWLLSAYSTPFAGELRIPPRMFALLKEQVMSVPDTPSRYLHDAPGSKPLQDDPVYVPTAAPVAAPVAAPATAPPSAPVTAPVAPVAAPASTPVAAPVTAPAPAK